jgi:uncharacterized protein (TIGR00730 family)
MELGGEIAAAGLGLVYGGANIGLMGAVANAALNAGAEVIGVLPQILAGKEIAHSGLTSLEMVPTMHERKARMAELADAFLILPGGYGTFDELMETSLSILPGTGTDCSLSLIQPLTPALSRRRTGGCFWLQKPRLKR